jgi:hypothetical protein
VGTPVYSTLFVEAEAGDIAGPMTKTPSSLASGSVYISSTTPSAGTASYRLFIPQADTYNVWCRVLAQNNSTDSFFVAVDGANEDIFDTGLETYSGSWQWTKLNGRDAGGIRQLTFSRGNHTITFRGRESGAALDAIYVTNDPDFVPVKLSIARSSRGRVEVSFVSPAGYRYGLQASENLKNWTDLWQTSVADANESFSFVDSSTAAGKRFYRVVRR